MSASASRAIVEALGDSGSRTIVEIGPGRGALTRLLLARSERLIAFEVDPTLAAQLRAEYAGEARIEILHQDILQANLSAFAISGPLRIVGNLPYYITSQILMHLFLHHRAIERAVLMVQREVAERIVASPGSRDYGLLSATAQMYAGVEKLFTLPPGDFSPPPKVHSTVLRLTMEPRFKEFDVEPQPFLRFLRLAFAQKRKTLANNLRAAGYDPSAIQTALARCLAGEPSHPEEPLLVRAEAVDLRQMSCLFRALEQ